MHIHFVCTGNAYRSRLAEAYLGSKQLKGIEVSSSGIEASKNKNGPICWYAARVLHYQGFQKYTSHSWRETTKDMLENADLVIFMHKNHLEYAKQYHGFSGNYELWNISDLSHSGLTIDKQSSEDDIRRIKITEETFEKIKRKTDAMILSLQKKPMIR